MTTPGDPLLERLRRLQGPQLDDVTAARTLARAEAAFASASDAHAGAPARRARWPVPAALALWGALYFWGAVREMGRLFPAERTARSAVAAEILRQGARRSPASVVTVVRPKPSAIAPGMMKAREAPTQAALAQSLSLALIGIPVLRSL